MVDPIVEVDTRRGKTKKRRMKVMDMDMVMVNITIWGDYTELDIQQKQIIVMTKMVVNEYQNQKQLSNNESSRIMKVDQCISNQKVQKVQ